MHLIQNRSDYGDTETIGKLWVDNQVFATIERPWLDNKGFESCVPEGEYRLVKHNGTKYKNTWAMISESNNVYHFPEDRPNDLGRYACIYHSANWSSQLHGCTALGGSHSIAWDKRVKESRRMVTSSRIAIREFLKLLDNGEDEHTLTIMNRK